VFRGVAFEFRWRDPRHRRAWDAAFFGGSLVATFAQGVTLGALLQGIAVSGRAYAGGWWDWLTPFSMLTGASLVIGYALLGAGWLIWKSEGPLHDDARRFARALVPMFLLALAAVSLATPSWRGNIMSAGSSGRPAGTAPMPLLVGSAAGCCGGRSRAARTMRRSCGRSHLPAVDGGAGGVDLARRDPGAVTIWAAAAAARARRSCLRARRC
jgi:cytochrome d ubiquinol oxidase subunit II